MLNNIKKISKHILFLHLTFYIFFTYSLAYLALAFDSKYHTLCDFRESSKIISVSLTMSAFF